MRSSTLLRAGLPALIAIAGVVVLVTFSTALGIALLIAAVLTVVANFYIRLTIDSNVDREEEAEARERFSRTGKWPE